MRIYLDIRNNIEPDIALQCVQIVIQAGKISNNNKSYCCVTTFPYKKGLLVVHTRPYRKNTCFIIYKEDKNEN